MKRSKRQNKCKKCEKNISSWNKSGLCSHHYQKGYYGSSETLLRKKTWRAKNKDKISKYNKSYRLKNKDKEKAYHKEYYQKNKEKIKKKVREHYKKNKLNSVTPKE